MDKIFQSSKRISKNLSLLNFFTIFVIFLMICLVVSPAKYIDSAQNGINLWATKLVPSLFPFFVLSKIIIQSNFLENKLCFLNPLTNNIFGIKSSSVYIFLISILSGYPIGSMLVLESYKCGKINLIEAKKIITSTSVSGPLFIIGTVGVGMLNNTTCGYIILLSHIFGAVFNGITYNFIFKLQKKNDCYKVNNTNSEPLNLTKAIKTSIDSILLIGGLVCIFYVGLDAISNIIPIPYYLQGVFEITNGANQISNQNISLFLKTLLCCAVITFGGFCTHLQSMCFLKQCDISYKFFLIQKITHTLYSSILCAILCVIFKIF